MMRVVAAIVIVCAVAPAHAETCEDEATTLRAHLEIESHRAFKWNTIWAIIYGAAAVGQLALAINDTKLTGDDLDDAAQETLYVGAVKATLGVGARLVTPLRIRVPARATDACADLHVLRRALADAGRRERTSFFMSHLGGMAVNLAGAAFLSYRHTLRDGIISFALSYPSGPLAAYSQPRRSWALWREREPTWTVGATVTGDGARLWLGGEW